ncbi:MAG: UPF0280 family protein [Lentisphaeria bacterium]|nr:UPF0280 family protein [Lentisphaeria bacterium]
MRRVYRKFSHKDSNFRISSACFEVLTAEIILQRRLLESYILRQPEFRRSLRPVALLPGAPAIAQRMAAAAALAAVGPMAAVAGALAQWGVEFALRLGETDCIVENGGDIYMASPEAVRIGVYAGKDSPFNRLAFEVQAEELPLALCSSSGKMGHALSLGCCDLACVVAKDAALADAAATRAGNLVQENNELQACLDQVMQISGLAGVMLIRGQQIGMAGKLPRLVKQAPGNSAALLTRDKNAGFEP